MKFCLLNKKSPRQPKKKVRIYKQNKFKVKNKKFILFFLIIPFIALIILIFRNKLFSIKNINCKIENIDCSSEKIHYENYFQNYNLIKIDKDEINRHFIINYPFIKSVEIKRKFPNSINIYLQHRTPIFQIKQKQSQKYFFVDENSYVIKNAYNSKLTTILTEEPIAVGEALSSQSIKSALSLFLVLKKSYIPVIEIDVIALSDLKTKIGSGQIVNFTGEKSIENQVDSLQFILKNSTISNKKIDGIDLRFDNPVVKYSLN